jgi:hypothetical protein
VRFQGLAAALTHGGNAQVSAYGASGEFCQPVSWHPRGPDVVVNVACFNAAGAPADSRFTALFLTPADLPGPGGFAWGDRPREGGYAPHRQYRFTPAAADMTVQRLALGTYSVRFAGLGGAQAAGGTVKASAYGPDPAICQPERWGAGAAEMAIVVRCFGPDGAPRDSTWSLLALRLEPGAPLAAPEPPLGVAELPQIVETIQPTPSPSGNAVTQRRLLPDGTAEIVYADGTVKKVFKGGYTITRPGQAPQTFLYQQAQPPTPPSLPAATQPWLAWHNESLLGIIRGLAGDEAAVATYLEQEQSDGLSLYDQIARRTTAIGWMLQE